MKTVMVTGAGGFIGQHTVRALVKRGYSVVAVDLWPDGIENDATKLIGNICSPYQMGIIFEDHRPDAVIHLAAQSAVPISWNDWTHDAHMNIIGTINVINLCLKHGIERIVYAGSGGTVYGDTDIQPIHEGVPVDPQSPYGVSKYAGECYVRMSGISHAILRYPNVYGPGQSPDGAAGVIAKFGGSILLDKPCIIYGDGKNTRDYVFIDDVVKANIAALESDASGVFNIGSATGISVKDVLELVGMAIGKNPIVQYESARQGDIRHIALDVEKARRELGWVPEVSFTDGIRRTVEAMTQGGQTVSRRLHGP